MASIGAFITTFLTYLGLPSSLIGSDPTTHKNWKLLNHEECGISYADRIIGGTKATLGQYPWLVTLGLTHYGVTVNVCGGAIITDTCILTAAHCVYKNNTNVKYRVRAGEHDFHSNPDCEGQICAPPPTDIDVSEVIVHKDYNKDGQYQNDICLMRLAKPLEFTDFIKPICVPYGNLATKDFTGQLMEVAGWGITTVGTSQMSDELYYVKLPVMEYEECKKTFQKYVKITHKQLCVGGIIGKDSCSGDSGGPLMKIVQFDGPPRYFMFGVVSYGPIKCGKTKYPGVYTNISMFFPWILDHLSL